MNNYISDVSTILTDSYQQQHDTVGQQGILIEDACCQLRGDVYPEGLKFDILYLMPDLGVAQC